MSGGGGVRLAGSRVAAADLGVERGQPLQRSQISPYPHASFATTAMAIATDSRDSRDNEDKVRCFSVSSPSLLPSVRSGWGHHGKVRASRHAVGLVLRSPLPNPSMNEVQYPLPLPAPAGCASDHWRPSSSSSLVSTTTPPRMPHGPGELMVMSIHTLRIGSNPASIQWNNQQTAMKTASSFAYFGIS
ncbi:unnamed protein product [Urochloa humidicola]